MNPETGRIHPDLASVERLARTGTQEESIEERLARAREKLERREADVCGPPLPPDWPRFSVGDEIPFAGWLFRIDFVDPGSSRIVISPARPDSGRRGSGKRRKRRR